jgi:hypothetical protein
MRRNRTSAKRVLTAIAAASAVTAVMVVPAATSAGAVDVPPTPQQQGAGEQRYVVAVHSFRAIDESGADWSGSDEVIGAFGSTRGHGIVTTSHGDVDTGDRVDFTNTERCLAPQRILSGGVTYGSLWAPEDRWECDPRGVPAPIGMHLGLWEDDDCSAGPGPACFDSVLGPLDNADDLIGRVEVTYDAVQLARLDRVGDSMNVPFTLGGPCGHQDPGHVCGVGGLGPTGPEYELRVVIKRVNDAPPRSTE